jgi:hypothetical protein
MLRGPVNVRLRPYHLAYSIELRYGGFIVALYVVAVCGTLLLSSSRRVVMFGIHRPVGAGNPIGPGNELWPMSRCRAMTMALGAAVLGWLRSCLPGPGFPGERR